MDVRFLVLVPAHNEEKVIAHGLQAIESDRRARDHVLVVADRCTDATAEIARSFGAAVLERGDDDEPGRAAARQAGLEHARALDWDAVVMLDADSVIEPGFFDACERGLSTGARAVQGRSESAHGPTLAEQASLAAFTLQGLTLPRGRDRLCGSVRLRGTGMAIRREVALVHRFSAPASEDLFFTLDLLLEGARCRHVERARVRSQGASSWEAFGGQKLRYEAGRMAAARTYLPRLLRRAVRHRDLACLDAAWFLATPPFALAALSLLAGAAVAAVGGVWSVAAAVRSGAARARGGAHDGSHPGSRRAAHVACAARGAAVHRLEGSGPAARARQHHPTRRVLPADHPRVGRCAASCWLVSGCRRRVGRWRRVCRVSRGRV